MMTKDALVKSKGTVFIRLRSIENNRDPKKRERDQNPMRCWCYTECLMYVFPF